MAINLMDGEGEMDLVLWRHAEAQDWEEGCDDMARTLTSRGEKQAARMAVWLDRQLPEGTRIFVSPSRRTEQTALFLERKYKVRQELAPNCSVSDLLELVQWPAAKGTVLVIGHQPTLGQTIAQLLGLTSAECSVKKGSVWWLRNREREALNQTVVVTVQSPDLL
jgi:phosphohistidine phosphatase